MKLKVKPSQRIKRRYLLVEGNKENIEKAILDYLGALGWAKASPIFVKSESGKNNVTVAVSREEVDNVKAAFEASNSGIRVIGISGTLKGLTKRFN
jgi:RNase P/RNase MRP subunit POP5